MKLLRTIRLDRSDTFVFARAAQSGEWAVPGGFMFWDSDPALLEGKARAAFRSGFLGIATLGWSTLAEVAEASEADVEAAVAQLAAHIERELAAPSAAAAEMAAREEIENSASLCEPPVGTIIALQRVVEADGEVRERFRTLTPALTPDGNAFGQGCVRPIGVVAVDGEAGVVDAEEVDLVALMGPQGKAERGRP